MLDLIGYGYGLISLITGAALFATFGLDKRLARLGGRRISESTLLWASWLGGWWGNWAAQQFFRHKTQKTSFQLQTAFATVVHLGLIGLWLWLKLRA